MIRVKKNKDKSIHGTYKSKDMTLKLLLENKKTLAETLKHKIEIFRETDDAILTQSFNYIRDYNIRLEKDCNNYTVSLTKTLKIDREHMDNIEKMLLEMIQTIDDNSVAMESNSSTNLLLNSSISLNSLQ